MSISRTQTNRRMSQAVSFGPGMRTVILAGQVAQTALESTASQTRDILGRIDALLGEQGARREDIVSASIWLADIGDFDAMNQVWDAWVPEGYAPARATVESRLARPELKVEIQVVAAVGQ